MFGVFSSRLVIVVLLHLSSWCLVMVEWLFLAVPWGCLRLVIVVFPDHTHVLFLQSSVLEYDKNCTQIAYFLQNIDFCIFEPKNREVIENSSNTSLNFSPSQCTCLGKKIISILLGLSQGKKIEKWLLRTSVQCYIY